MLRTDQLSYTYPQGERHAVHDVSLKIAGGDFVLVAGPSGSGKSTLLRCFNGLVPHFTGGVISGSIEVNGLDALKSGPQVLSRHVGFVLQTPEAQATLDRVEPEIAFGLENAAVPTQEMRLRVEEVLDLLDLTPLRNRPLSKLSGGERQRVAIASALALKPQILVLDEPTSQLDPQSAEEVLHALVRLNEDLGLTILLAEQRLERVLRYADRVIYLENGRIVVDDEVRKAAAKLPQLPPLVDLSRKLQWQPLPLTIREGQRFARRIDFTTVGAKIKHAASVDDRSESTPPEISPLLEAGNVHFSYNGAAAVNGVTLNVNPGEAVALMGRNGSGKSTLLKCLVGLLSPEEGHIAVNGLANAGRQVADICRDVAYLPQNPDDLLFAESVREELDTTLRNHGLPPSSTAVMGLLRQLGLSETAHAYPRDLSVGQRQRVALGAVSITKPKLLLMDEPTRGLDYQSKRALVKIWQRWLAKGMGLLLVTHDVEMAAMIADRVIILSQGEVIAAGSSSEILGATSLFSPQIAKLFPGTGWLTVDDALSVLDPSGIEKQQDGPLPLGV